MYLAQRYSVLYLVSPKFPIFCPRPTRLAARPALPFTRLLRRLLAAKPLLLRAATKPTYRLRRRLVLVMPVAPHQ